MILRIFKIYSDTSDKTQGRGAAWVVHPLHPFSGEK
jgi:hypothetical protein